MVFISDAGKSYGRSLYMRVRPLGIVRLRRAGDNAVVLMRSSSADDSELRGGAAFVKTQNTNSSAQ